MARKDVKQLPDEFPPPCEYVPPGEPTAAEIAERAAEIRAEWTPAVECLRRGVCLRAIERGALIFEMKPHRFGR